MYAGMTFFNVDNQDSVFIREIMTKPWQFTGKDCLKAVKSIHNWLYQVECITQYV